MDKPMEYIFVYDFLSICGFINIVNKNYFFEFNNLIENAANKVLEFGFTLEDFTNFNYSNLLDIEHLLEKSIENDKGFKLPSVSTLINRGPSEELFNNQSTSTSFSGSSNIIQPSTNLTTNELRKLYSKCCLIGGDFEKYKDETSLTKFVEIICGIDYKQLKFKMEEYNKILENKIILYKTLMEKIESNYLYENLITSFMPCNASIAGLLAKLILYQYNKFVSTENVFCLKSENRISDILLILKNKFSDKKMILISEDIKIINLAQQLEINCNLINTNDDYIRIN
ncbi:Eyes absent-like protein [Meloidogyne graminicola]|uniref:Eyes absent-like protein n=1 Tax=Meloidogyne graminicola TaxID=189291 RepID=A0A8S9ZZJ6_9BILA|nr:Eyes absent-like protein [Meloidogyne graminicola]